MYERNLAQGQILRAKSNFLLNKLPHRIKSILLVEALTGTTVSGLCEAIFDVGVAEDENLFDERNDEQIPQLRSDLENAQLSPSSLQSEEEISKPSSDVCGGIPIATSSTCPERGDSNRLSKQHEERRSESPDKVFHQQGAYGDGDNSKKDRVTSR